MTDFFEEIDEQLRSDQLKQHFQRLLPWAIGIAAAALIAALAYWGYDTWRTKEAAKASEAYSAALDSMQKGDLNQAFIQFGQAERGVSPGYKTLALMEQAGIRLDQGKHEEGVELLDKAASAAPTPLLGDLARLKSALALMDTAPYSTMEERLKPLIDAKRPYHAAAREALAMAKLKAGHLQDARSDLQVIQLMPDATEASRQRAQVAILAIDSGVAANLNAVIKTAQAMPAAPVTMPGLPDDAGAGQ